MTLIIIPSRGAKPRQLVLPRFLMYAGGGVTALAALCVLGILVWSGSVLLDAREARSLRKDVARLGAENARIVVLEKTLRDLKASQEKILTWAGLPAPVSADHSPTDQATTDRSGKGSKERAAKDRDKTDRAPTEAASPVSNRESAEPDSSALIVASNPSPTTPMPRLSPVKRAERPGWRWPVDGWVSRRYEPVSPGADEHAGVDIAAPRDTPVLAASSGMVTFAGWDDELGNMVVIEHAFGLKTIYGHNSAILIASGANVSEGQAIARVGSTGRSSAPHLHFEVRHSDEPIDPVAFLSGEWKMP